MENAKFKEQPKGFATKAIHAGQNAEQWDSRCVVPPIIMSTTFQQDVPGEHKGFYYGRSGNPVRNVLETCLASLDNAKYAVTFASGLGAVTALISMFSFDDHIILGDDIYGGTSRLLRTVANRFGIISTFVDPTSVENIEAAINKNTKMIFVETPTNPLLKIVDIQKIVDLLKKFKEQKIILAVDNTFLSPYFQRPIELGADIALYSLTKYMNGHSDIVMGAIATDCSDLHERLQYLQKATGIVPSPFDCYQVNRSLKTLSLRMQQHSKSSLAIAKFLETHPAVVQVLHPALPSHTQHKIALKQSYGHSGIVSFYIAGGLEESKRFLKHLKVFILAESLGGYESLAQLPSIMTHASVPVEERLRIGITDNLIRLSVGLEDVDDLIADLGFALNELRK